MSTSTTSPIKQELHISRGSVTSADGTRIGYLRIGAGPALVILHGSFQSAASHLGLATALADAHTVFLPDRRGHAMSGPTGAGYGMHSEIEDLRALLTESGACDVFGVSSSGLIALAAARHVHTIRRIAVYEPALLKDRTKYLDWMPNFADEIARGDVAEALITSMVGLDLAPPIFKVMPRRLLVTMTRKAMRAEEKAPADPGMTMRALAPAIHNEGVLLSEMAGTIADYTRLDTDVLLMGGSRRGPAFIRPALDALAVTLPRCTRLELYGLDHGSPADPSKTNRYGNPTAVAAAMRPFFS